MKWNKITDELSLPKNDGLYFCTRDGIERSVEIEHFDKDTTAFIPSGSRYWLRNYVAWMNFKYPPPYEKD